MLIKFIRGISSLLDVSVNEYSVFMLNHSSFSKSLKDIDISSLLNLTVRQFISENCNISNVSISHVETAYSPVDFLKDFIMSFSNT